MEIIDAFFHAFGKYDIFRHPFIIFVRVKIIFLGKNLSAVFVISSTPGAFFLGSLEIIFCTVPGVVKILDWVMMVLLISRTVEFISGYSDPGFGEN
jgi:hypothetical protein